jgi:hypothetical protein
MNRETRECSWCGFEGATAADLVEHLRTGCENAQRWARDYRGLSHFAPPASGPSLLRHQRQVWEYHANGHEPQCAE